ncbi:hypothetical protein L1049_010009 [Liquidambar formosana]|uniref:F-box domain-containing protein n=1 Tax=Liquidambar formosana TaxID=63359 RepID=A0AAP0N8C1_LIQFO
MSILPEDIISDILSRLPVKTLLRFKCASKPWCGLIDGPDFIKMHFKRSTEHNTNLSLILTDDSLYSVDFDTLDYAVELDDPAHPRTEIVGSCNGLLCLGNAVSGSASIWNPSTRKHHNLPVSTIQTHPGCICEFFIYGFGYDYAHDDYKLVKIIQLFDSVESQVQVEFGILASGALHWVVTRWPGLDMKIVVAFDVGLEEYREVPQPEYLGENFDMNLGVLGGFLCILCNYSQIRVDIWVMKEYGVKESWNKHFSVLDLEYTWSIKFIKPLAYSKCGDKVLLILNKEEFIWYDIEKKTVANAEIRTIPDYFEAEICLGSLVTLNGDGGIDGKKPRKKNWKRRISLAFMYCFC